jgi:hypothetical protein
MSGARAIRTAGAVTLAWLVFWPRATSAQPADAGPPPPDVTDAGPPPEVVDAGPPPDAAATPPAPPEPPEPPEVEQPAPPQRHTAESVKDAPLPDEARGLTRGEPGPGPGRTVARVLLFPVRVIVWLVAAPIRGTLWAYERYRLRDRWKAIFFNDEETIGLYPVAFFETGFGFNVGARFIHRDLFGNGERFKARASFGGRFQQIYAAGFDSGQLMGELVELELEAQYEIRPHDQFFGIGNGDQVDDVAAPIDPYDDPTAVDSRFRQTTGRVSALADVLLIGPLSGRLSSAVLWKSFDRSDLADIEDDEDIANHYQLDALPAFEDGANYVYSEFELRYDTRRPANRFEAASVPSQGLLVSGFTGLASGFEGARTAYVRYGTDLQAYINLGASPRALVLRALVEGIEGDLEQVPFVDLPRLGGPILLRGYKQDRFRDRVMALGSAEYQFDVSNMFSAFLFVDGGRVYRDLTQVKEEGADDLRVGYGGGLQLHTDRTFIGRFSVASSIDGGVLFHLSLDPVYDPKARVERK